MSSRPHRSASTGAHRHVGPVHRGPQAIAPIHRGPQAVSHASTLSSQVHHAPNAALLIDFDNVTMGIRSDLQTELKNLLSSDIVKGKVSVQRAYADWRRYPQYIVPLAESSIDLIFAPAYGSAKKNATDIRLAIDALELVFTRPEIGTFILLSGDSDFSSLVIKLKEYGKYVIGVGIRESSSDLLVQNCDEYYSYNALAGLVKSTDDEPARKYDPWELVKEAITRMKQNDDTMRADRLKQVMQDIDPNFDEKDLGMAKFSRFVHDAAQRGLLTLTRLENGQYEIGVPAARAAAAPAAPA
ncbi:MAG: NYN domain-containing protein, partial [Gemmatimonadaceae bacterium]